MTTDYTPGTILLVWPKAAKPQDGFLFQFEQPSVGDEDLSYHGTPFYENFIVGTELATGGHVAFGDQNYSWCDVLKHVQYLHGIIKQVSDLTRYV